MTSELTTILTLPFFQRALVTGCILGVLLALMGVLVVLRKMSFFSDAIGHSALTGIAISLLINANPLLGATIFAMALAGIIGIIKQRSSRLSIDTLLGIFFPAAMALGVILLRFSPGYQTDLVNFLFGDILTVSPLDSGISVLLAVITGGALLITGKSLILIALDETLAHTEGIPVTKYELLLLVLLAAIIAMSIKLVGIVLVTAMLVIPAASAQNMARSLSHMFVLSSIVSLLAVIGGMVVSAIFNLPSGPTIILVGALLFIASFLLKPLIKPEL